VRFRRSRSWRCRAELGPGDPIAASRAGATGILDLAGRRDPVAAAAAVARLFALGVPRSAAS